MNKTWIIFKNTFIDSYNLNKTLFNKSKDAKTLFKKIGFSILVIYLIVYLMFIVGMYTYTGTNYLKNIGLETITIPIAIIITTFSMFMTSIFKSKATIFSVKDSDILFSMPLKPREILISKLMNLLISNYIMVFVIFIPMFIVYGYLTNQNAMYYFNSSIVFIFLPIIPTILSAGVGYIIALISNKFGKKSLVELITTFLFIMFFAFLPSFGKQFVDVLVANLDLFSKIIKTVFFPVYCMQEAMLNQSIMYLLYFIIISIVLFCIFIATLSKSFMKISIKLQENKIPKKYLAKKLNISSKQSTLLKKEFKTYISVPIYIINTLFGVVMLVVGAIASFFYSSDDIIKMLQMPEFKENIFAMLAMASGFIVSLSSTTAASISLEGQNINLIKSLPISTKSIFNSKILLNILMVLPATLLSITIISLKFGLSLNNLGIILTLSSVLTIAVSQFGLIVNLLFPKLEFKTPTQVVKQSLAVFVVTFGMMGIDAICIVLYNLVLSPILSLDIYILILIIIGLIICLIQDIILNKWGIKKFKSLSY